MLPLAQSRRKRGFLLATGQTTQYDGMPDDGYYRKGIAKSFTVLETGQYAGATNIALNGKTDVHSNNCVFDNNTGLMWSRYMAGSVGTGSDGKLPWITNGSGEGIFAYCAAANAALLSGYYDWRIPNLFELSSILDIQALFPDVTAFPSTGTWGDLFWTSTLLAGDVTYPYAASMVFVPNYWGGNSVPNYLFLVRG